MVDPGETNQGDAPNLCPGCGGHDQPRGPSRGWDPQKPSHQIQRQPNLRKLTIKLFRFLNCDYYA